MSGSQHQDIVPYIGVIPGYTDVLLFQFMLRYAISAGRLLLRLGQLQPRDERGQRATFKFQSQVLQQAVQPEIYHDACNDLAMVHMI